MGKRLKIYPLTMFTLCSMIVPFLFAKEGEFSQSGEASSWQCKAIPGSEWKCQVDKNLKFSATLEQATQPVIIDIPASNVLMNPLPRASYSENNSSTSHWQCIAEDDNDWLCQMSPKSAYQYSLESLPIAAESSTNYQQSNNLAKASHSERKIVSQDKTSEQDLEFIRHEIKLLVENLALLSNQTSQNNKVLKNLITTQVQALKSAESPAVAVVPSASTIIEDRESDITKLPVSSIPEQTVVQTEQVAKANNDEQSAVLSIAQQIALLEQGISTKSESMHKSEIVVFESEPVRKNDNQNIQALHIDKMAKEGKGKSEYVGKIVKKDDKIFDKEDKIKTNTLGNLLRNGFSTSKPNNLASKAISKTSSQQILVLPERSVAVKPVTHNNRLGKKPARQQIAQLLMAEQMMGYSAAEHNLNQIKRKAYQLSQASSPVYSMVDNSNKSKDQYSQAPIYPASQTSPQTYQKKPLIEQLPSYEKPRSQMPVQPSNHYSFREHSAPVMSDSQSLPKVPVIQTRNLNQIKQKAYQLSQAPIYPASQTSPQTYQKKPLIEQLPSYEKPRSQMPVQPSNHYSFREHSAPVMSDSQSLPKVPVIQTRNLNQIKQKAYQLSQAPIYPASQTSPQTYQKKPLIEQLPSYEKPRSQMPVQPSNHYSFREHSAPVMSDSQSLPKVPVIRTRNLNQIKQKAYQLSQAPIYPASQTSPQTYQKKPLIEQLPSYEKPRSQMPVQPSNHYSFGQHLAPMMSAPQRVSASQSLSKIPVIQTQALSTQDMLDRMQTPSDKFKPVSDNYDMDQQQRNKPKEKIHTSSALRLMNKAKEFDASQQEASQKRKHSTTETSMRWNEKKSDFQSHYQQTISNPRAPATASILQYPSSNFTIQWGASNNRANLEQLKSRYPQLHMAEIITLTMNGQLQYLLVNGIYQDVHVALSSLRLPQWKHLFQALSPWPKAIGSLKINDMPETLKVQHNISSLPQGGYVIQWAASNDVAYLHRLQQGYPQFSRAKILKLQRSGLSSYILVDGYYSDRLSAIDSLSGPSASDLVQFLHPKARPIASLRNALTVENGSSVFSGAERTETLHTNSFNRLYR